MANVNPFTRFDVPGIGSMPVKDAKRSGVTGTGRIPAGMEVLYSTISGSKQAIGYADPSSNLVVIFKDADVKTAAKAATYAGAHGLQATAADVGGTQYTKPQEPATPQAAAAQAPAAGQQANAATGGSTIGVFVPSPGGMNTTGTQVGPSHAVGGLTGTESIFMGVDEGRAAAAGSFIAPDVSTALIAQGTMSVDDAVKKLYSMQPDDLRALQQKLIDAGYGTSGLATTGMVDKDTIASYQGLLLDTLNYQRLGDGSMTPSKLLDATATARESSGGNGLTTTSSSVQTTDAFTAQGKLEAAFHAALGRDPTPQELSAFTAALNASERANPTTTTRTDSNTTGTGQNSVSQSTSGGFDPDQFAQDYVNQNFGPEVNADKAGSAFNILAQAMFGGAPTSAGPS